MTDRNLDNMLSSDEVNPSHDIPVVSDTDLRLFFRCPYALYIKNHIGASKVPRTAFAALSMFFANERKRLFSVRDQRIGRVFPFQHRAGPSLDLAQEMTRDDLGKYILTADFGKRLHGAWLQIAKKAQYAGSPIVWSYRQQGYHSALMLQAAGERYLDFVLDNQAPVLGFMNKDVYFPFRGILFRTRFPELRKGVIDDPRIWGFNADFPHDAKRDISNSSLVTLRILAYCQLAYKFPFYRDKWMIDDKKAEAWQPPHYLDHSIRYRAINCTKNTVEETVRDSSHLDRLVGAVDTFLDSVHRENYQPNLRHCPSCQYNVLGLNGENICSKQRKGIKPAVPSYYFKKRSFSIEKRIGDSRVVLKGFMNKEDAVRKAVATFNLRIDAEHNVWSDYRSHAPGYGFEIRMIEAADKVLQELAQERKVRLTHVIGFAENFRIAGQRKIEETLQALGYVDFKKVYGGSG
jgi:hypothetical protein